MPRSTASRATIDTGSFVLNPDEPRPAHVSFAISDERSRAYRSLSPTTRAVLELRLNETTRLLQDRHDVGRRRSRGRLPAVGRADPAARGAERADRARRRDVFRDRVP